MQSGRTLQPADDRQLLQEWFAPIQIETKSPLSVYLTNRKRIIGKQLVPQANIAIELRILRHRHTPNFVVAGFSVVEELLHSCRNLFSSQDKNFINMNLA